MGITEQSFVSVLHWTKMFGGLRGVVNFVFCVLVVVGLPIWWWSGRLLMGPNGEFWTVRILRWSRLDFASTDFYGLFIKSNIIC